MLRLDRIGDVLMSLPALADLRARAARGAHPPGRGPLERGDRAAARPWTRCSSGARPGSGRPQRRRGAPARALRAQGARAARAAASTSRSTCRATCAPSLLLCADRRAPARRLRQHRRRATCSPTWCRSTRPSPGSSRTAARWRSALGARPRRRRRVDPLDARRTASFARAPARRRWASPARRPLVGHPPQRRAARQAVAGRALGARWRARLQAELGATVARHRLRGRPAAGRARSRAGLRGAADRPHGPPRRARDAWP